MGGFAQGVVADVDGEDPNMLKFIENELAKRRAGAGGGDASGDGGGDAAAAAKTDEERLWETPAELSTKKTEGAETADRWLTGIVEVQLPMDYKMRNIEETELAKQAMLERQRGGDGGDAEAAAARAALERQRSAAAPERREHQARPTFALVPIRPRSRGERRFLRTSLSRARHLSAQGPSLSIPTRLDAFQLHF